MLRRTKTWGRSATKTVHRTRTDTRLD